MVLGLIGTGFAWRYVASVWPAPPVIGEVLVAVATLIWLLLAGCFVSLFPATSILVIKTTWLLVQGKLTPCSEVKAES
ncbi:hypothetical protein [Enterobacillus tribolii]|nr:hypothetical protein [Enterobacillus tribolii]